MSNITKLEFTALNISGKNYLSWVLDAKIHLNAKGLGDTIMEENKASSQDKANAIIFIRHHLDEGLKIEYLTVEDPLELWNSLKERYDHQKTVILPKARYEWIHLRLQDFKSVTEYNSSIFKISSKLKLCGEKITDEDLLEKTFSTFHASNLLLQQQYRERGFKKYSQLITCLLVAKQNNKLLMKNHENRPTGSAPFPEVNAAIHNNLERGGRGRGRGCGRGRGNYSYHHCGSPSNHLKWNHENKQKKGKNAQTENSKGIENSCFRCGMKGHWSRTCRTPDHFVKLYQASIKGKGKIVEANFADNDDVPDFANQNANIEANLAYKDDELNGLASITHLDMDDFFAP